MSNLSSSTISIGWSVKFINLVRYLLVGLHPTERHVQSGLWMSFPYATSILYEGVDESRRTLSLREGDKWDVMECETPVCRCQSGRLGFGFSGLAFIPRLPSDGFRLRAHVLIHFEADDRRRVLSKGLTPGKVLVNHEPEEKPYGEIRMRDPSYVKTCIPRRRVPPGFWIGAWDHNPLGIESMPLSISQQALVFDR